MRYYIYLLLFVFISFSSCASLQTYAKNRALDFTDILTLGGEVKTVGASAWFWCLGGGVQHGQFGEGWGMRNGYIGHYRTGGHKKLRYATYGNSFLLFNSQEHSPETNKTARSIHKRYEHGNFLLLIPTLNKGLRIGFVSPSATLPDSSKLPELCKAPLNLEISAGLGLGGRVGINFSELLDFVLGFTTFDLMDDDLHKITEAEDE